MRYISTKNLKEGMKIAKTIYSNTGKIILPANVSLNADLIEKIKRSNIPHLWIEDKRVDDITISEIIPLYTKLGLLNCIRGIFYNLKEMKKNLTNPIPKYGFITGVIDIDKIMSYISDIIEEMDIIEDPTCLNVEKEITLTEVDNLDEYLPVHSLNRMILSFAIAKELRLKKDKFTVTLGKHEMSILLISSLLCDIGMAFIKEDIVTKKDKLSEKEFQEIKLHPQFSRDILAKIKGIDIDIIKISYQHHERINGKGYPMGITGDKIHLFAKIIAICDTYASLISKRHFRDAYPSYLALEYILAGAGDLFDYEMAEKFSHLIPAYPKGVMVELNTGEKGCVVNVNKGFIGRPVIRIFYDKDGREIQEKIEYDLLKPEHQTKMIVKILDE